MPAYTHGKAKASDNFHPYTRPSNTSTHLSNTPRAHHHSEYNTSYPAGSSPHLSYGQLDALSVHRGPSTNFSVATTSHRPTPPTSVAMTNVYSPHRLVPILASNRPPIPSYTPSFPTNFSPLSQDPSIYALTPGNSWESVPQTSVYDHFSDSPYPSQSRYSSNPSVPPADAFLDVSPVPHAEQFDNIRSQWPSLTSGRTVSTQPTSSTLAPVHDQHHLVSTSAFSYTPGYALPPKPMANAETGAVSDYADQEVEEVDILPTAREGARPRDAHKYFISVRFAQRERGIRRELSTKYNNEWKTTIRDDPVQRRLWQRRWEAYMKQLDPTWVAPSEAKKAQNKLKADGIAARRLDEKAATVHDLAKESGGVLLSYPTPSAKASGSQLLNVAVSPESTQCHSFPLMHDAQPIPVASPPSLSPSIAKIMLYNHSPEPLLSSNNSDTPSYSTTRTPQNPALGLPSQVDAYFHSNSFDLASTSSASHGMAVWDDALDMPSAGSQTITRDIWGFLHEDE